MVAGAAGFGATGAGAGVGAGAVVVVVAFDLPPKMRSQKELFWALADVAAATSTAVSRAGSREWLRVFMFVSFFRLL
jgi:hypothetical protein